jgi:hypothetical protein
MNPGSLACFWRGSDKKKYEFINNKDREKPWRVSG